MRKLTVDPSEDPVTPDTLFALQLRAAGEPLLPRLVAFKCKNANAAFIPFIPSFLCRKTVQIGFHGFSIGTPTLMVTSMIVRLPALSPDLEHITLSPLPRDPSITEAVSEMLITCNRNTLQWFRVDSPLTEEARGVAYQLPKLSELCTVVQGRTLLPPVALPNITVIDLEYGAHFDWLQGFRGQVLDNLDTIYFSSHSNQAGDFLGAFESVALTTSIPTALSTFWYTTTRPWNPNYRPLLSFVQLNNLVVAFPCNEHCSSGVDDNLIVDLVRALPKLGILKLGGAPCGNPTGITAKGLIALACGCRHLSELRIHFQTASLIQPVPAPGTLSPTEGEPVVRRQDCALTSLEVGETPIPAGAEWVVTIALLQIFPRLLEIGSRARRWEVVLGNLRRFKQIGAFVHNTSEAHLPDLFLLK